MPTERSPLLDGASTRALPQDAAARTGPLEISAANRRAILAGIWMATFLSVRTRPRALSSHCSPRASL